MKFMEFLFYTAICISLYFLGEFARKSHMEGVGLNKKIKPYHQEIATLLSPYKGTTFYKEVMLDAQTALKELLAEFLVVLVEILPAS